MTIDDPCDELPERVRLHLWGKVMLDRTTDDLTRRCIGYAMNSHYGMPIRPADRRDDPCDDWSASIALRWVPAMDRRTRGGRRSFIVADDKAFIDHGDVPGWNNQNEYRTWSLDKRDKP